MNCAVVYFSRSGNTKKLADGVAEVLGVTASDITTSLTEKTDLVFQPIKRVKNGVTPVGSSIYVARLITYVPDLSEKHEQMLIYLPLKQSIN